MCTFTIYMYMPLYVEPPAHVDVRGSGGDGDQQPDEGKHGHHEDDDQLLQVVCITTCSMCLYTCALLCMTTHYHVVAYVR